MAAQQDSNPKVEYRRLGKSGLRVSVPILGAMSFGSDKWSKWIVNEDKGLPLLEAAWKLGVTTWDTSGSYSNGESERIIGKALKKYNIPRERVVILTKCFFIVSDDIAEKSFLNPKLRDNRDYTNAGGLSRAAIFSSVDASLARLDTPYIDLLQIHRADLDGVTAEETMKALHDLVQSGKVRYIGASSMWTWQFQHYNHVAEKHGWTPFISMQNQYSLNYREEEREMIKYCKFAGIGIIPWGPLNAGQLARPLETETVRSEINKTAYGASWNFVPSEAEAEVINRIERTANEKGWLMSQVALAWIKEKITSPIVGIGSIKRLEEAIVTDFQLTDDEIKYLEEPYKPMAIRGHW